jgi:hypothetical protein
MFCNFYLVKSHNIAHNTTSTEAREKINRDLESIEFLNFFAVYLTKFETYQILLNKISHRFLVTTKVFSGWKSLIQNVILLLFFFFSQVSLE